MIIPRIEITDDPPAEGPVAFRRDGNHLILLVWRGLPVEVRGEAVRAALRMMRETRRRDAVLVPAALGMAAVSAAAHRHPGFTAAGAAATAGAAVAGVAIGLAPGGPPASPAATGPQPTITRTVPGPRPPSPRVPHGARPARAVPEPEERLLYPVSLARASGPVPAPRPAPAPTSPGPPHPSPTVTPPPASSPPPSGQRCILRLEVGKLVRVCLPA